ncbi:MAG TPA: malto-oligosyltrehalose trehalohydrolase, partial [Candidatus Dormibacteraeota bacterium]|nr:malto-oligosyltrehalose trehalohydrolase [Candidatus Dormibacteraeota bacterium]
MTEVRVWAPEHVSMQILVYGERRDMTRDGEYFIAELPPGDAEYSLIVDGDPLPDPRSQWQPHGVHGASRLDTTPFDWTDHDWHGASLAGAVIYELHIGTFSEAGTFDGAIAHLDHLVNLGVTAVELMPVAEFPGSRGWGYDGVDLHAPHHAYGGPDGLRRFVDAAHARGLAVVLDVVYNHLGPDGNYLGRFAPYFTDRYRTPWGSAVNFDGEYSDGVRDFVLDNACRWLEEFRIDGLRLDAVHAIVDTSAVHILEELAQRVRAVESKTGRRRWLIAESDLNDPRLVHSTAAGGYGLDAQWSDDFHHALHALLTGERTGYYADFGTVADVATALREAYVYAGRYSHYRRRRFGRPASGVSGSSFLGYIQNHDQVGNRARGDRIAQVAGLARAKIAAALVFCSPFVPLVFAGEEWAASTPFQYFTDHVDPELARAVSQGRRREFAAFGWPPEDIPDPQDEATFTRSRLDWSEPAREPHAQMLAWYRALIRLRHTTPALRDGDLETVEVSYAEDPAHLVLHRGAVTVACNFSPMHLEVATPHGELVLSEPAGLR